MTAAFVAAAVGGNGQSAAVTNVNITIPATAAAGNVAVLTVETSFASATVVTPTGWTKQSGPDATTTTAFSYFFTKTLVSGDVGAVLNVSQGSSSSRLLASMRVYSGVTETGLVFAANVNEASTSSPALPSLASVPAGAALDGCFTRRRGGTPATTVTVPSGYTAAGAAATNFGAVPEISVQGCYKIATSAGTYGGETGSGSSASIGTNYLVALPATGTTRTGKAKYWTGSAWVAHPVKFWTGSAWAIHPAKGWDGSSWVVGK